jgi:hypothetical protein
MQLSRYLLQLRPLGNSQGPAMGFLLLAERDISTKPWSKSRWSQA